MSNDEFIPSLIATDWNEEWKKLQVVREKTDDSTIWDAKAKSFPVKHGSQEGYVAEFLRLAGIEAHETVLDMGCGTGALATPLALQGCNVVASDFSQGMLDVAREKIARRGLSDAITVQQGDCLALPFEDGSFDAVTVAFGVRNFEHLLQGYKEMHRVLEPGGTLCVVELSTPRNRVVRWFYDLYTLHIIPWMGSLKSGDRSAYRYLPQSIAAVPQGDDMLAIMREAGFTNCEVKRLTLGTCSIYVGNA